jgi:biopolymer transport protein ExbD
MRKSKKRRNRQVSLVTVDMNMTPIIDVVFNLLIFFMCQIKFKQLEGKLDSYLPTDRGAMTTQMTEMLEDISIRLSVKGANTVIAVNGKPVATLPVPRADADGKWRVSEKPPILPELEKIVKQLHDKQPDVAAVVEPDRNVPTGHVVAVVDACLAVGHNKINFAMAAAPVSAPSK